MNKLKPIFIAAVLAVFSVVNAQEAAAPIPTPIPAQPAAPAAAPTQPAAPAVVPAPTQPAAPAAVPAQPAVPAPVATPAAEVPAATPAPIAAPAAEAPAPQVTDSAAAPVVAEPAADVAEAPVPQATDSAAIEPKTDSSTAMILIVEPKKKKRGSRTPKNDFTIVDVPANFEIQARKVMPIDSEEWGDDNLDTWWGRANLMVLTESENFVGKIHLRMYPGELYGNETKTREKIKLKQDEDDDDYIEEWERRDFLQIYEAWAWHRGDYVNVKIGRWDNTTRFGSMTYGGYVDAKKDKYFLDNMCIKENYKVCYPERNRRADGFMSTYDPENALQLGFNNFSENVSLDIALISSDANLNKGDLRAYFHFKDLAGIDNMNIGIGYRSNIFDEIWSRYVDVTHTVDIGFRLPVIRDIGILKDFSLFGEFAFIGLDDQSGDHKRQDNGKSGKEYSPVFPILGGLDFSLYQGLDKVVIEAEYDGERRNKVTGGKENVRDIQASIFLQKKLNDRFTLNMGMQSENNTKDFSFAGRLQGRIN